MLQVEAVIQENVREEKEQIQKYYPTMPEEAKGSYLADYEKQLTDHISRRSEDIPEEEKSKIWMDVFMYGEHLSDTLIGEYYKDFHMNFKQLSEIFIDILASNGVEPKLASYVQKAESSNLESLYESKEMKREHSYRGCYDLVRNLVDKVLSKIDYYQEELSKGN